MFPKEHLHEFLKYKEEENWDVDENVKESYYIFIYDFMRILCPTFKEHLKNLMKSPDEKPTFLEHITVSDEAYVWWVLLIRWDEISSEADAIIENSESKLKSAKKRGAHDSKKYYHELEARIHYVKQFRYGDYSNDKIKQGKYLKQFQFWMDIFFNQFRSAKMVLQRTHKKRKFDYIEEKSAPRKNIIVPNNFF